MALGSAAGKLPNALNTIGHDKEDAVRQRAPSSRLAASAERPGQSIEQSPAEDRK